MQNNHSNPTYKLSGLISVLGLVALLAGLIIIVLLPDIRYAAWAMLLLGVLLLATAFVIDFKKVSSAITGKRGLFSTGTTVMASIFIGITLLVNAISIGNFHRFDVTGLSQFTLTSQTKDTLSQLEEPIQISIFTVPGDILGNAIRDFLSEYQNNTEELSLDTIDPEEHPDQARQYGITLYPTVVFKRQENVKLVSWQDIVVQLPNGEVSADMEHPFTSAILEVAGIAQKKLYFLTGHGESSIGTDYSSARQGLQDYLYKVGTLDLQLTPAIPEDATALIIAGPRRSLTSAEVTIIESFLENNGWLMVLLNPDSPPEYEQLFSAWGINIKDGTIIDPSSYLSPSIESPLVPRSRNMMGLSDTYFPGATAIIPQEEISELIIQQPLFFTSQDSWLEKDFDPSKEPEFDEGIDEKGPLAIGVLIAGVSEEEVSTEVPEATEITRMVIVGDSDFASNQHFYNGDNGNLFLNLVEVLTAGKELIEIERKVLPFRRLIVSQETANFINISSIALLPFLVLVMGGVIWWRRR
ncbi:GldG family protein [Chloroflexota bacterium]